MSNFTLKMIAIIAMAIDHTAAVLIPDNTMTYLIMRIIGRIAFPIFCFLIVEGFYHTKNVHQYMARLSIFALLSEIPFDLAFYQKPFAFEDQNVFFTLAIGLAVIYGIKKMSQIFVNKKWLASILQLLIFFVGGVIAIYLKTDYNFMGVALIYILFMYRESKWMLSLMVILINTIYSSGIQKYASLSLLLILLYNGKQGPKVRYVFYAFYPTHLFILYLISQG